MCTRVRHCRSDDSGVDEYEGTAASENAGAQSLKFLSLYNPKLFMADVDTANVSLRRALTRTTSADVDASLNVTAVTATTGGTP